MPRALLCLTPTALSALPEAAVLRFPNMVDFDRSYKERTKKHYLKGVVISVLGLRPAGQKFEIEESAGPCSF